MEGIIDFARECAQEEFELGDLARDILRDPHFPMELSEEEQFAYLEYRTFNKESNDALQIFKEAYYS